MERAKCGWDTGQQQQQQQRKTSPSTEATLGYAGHHWQEFTYELKGNGWANGEGGRKTPGEPTHDAPQSDLGRPPRQSSGQNGPSPQGWAPKFCRCLLHGDQDSKRCMECNDMRMPEHVAVSLPAQRQPRQEHSVVISKTKQTIKKFVKF